MSGSGVGESGSVGRVSSRAGPRGRWGGLSKNDSLKNRPMYHGRIQGRPRASSVRIPRAGQLRRRIPLCDRANPHTAAYPQSRLHGAGISVKLKGVWFDSRTLGGFASCCVRGLDAPHRLGRHARQSRERAVEPSCPHSMAMGPAFLISPEREPQVPKSPQPGSMCHYVPLRS